MTRRVPAVATAVVIAAVAAMLGLGTWQLKRAQWKESLLAQYAGADSQPAIDWPVADGAASLPLFRRASGMCLEPAGKEARAGQSRSGESGYVFLFECAGSSQSRVEVGWSQDPQARFAWKGGPVGGTIAPDRRAGLRLVLDQAPAGLEPSAKPDLSAISNNHRLYAIQWFAFAAIALVVYALALRGRGRPAR